MRAVAETEASQYLDWTAPDGSVVIRLARPLIARMNVEVMRGFGVTRRRGTEIGGLLLGRLSGGSKPVIFIDDFESIPCEYAFGPSYVLSPDDQARFAEAVARHDREAVGFFRSHTREGLALADADVELATRHLSRLPYTALLIKPFATRSGIASFFVPSNGALRLNSQPSEFDFSPETEAQSGGRNNAPRPATPPVPQRVVDPPTPVAPAPSAETVARPPTAEPPTAQPVDPPPDKPTVPAPRRPDPAFVVPDLPVAASSVSPEPARREPVWAGRGTTSHPSLVDVLGIREEPGPLTPERSLHDRPLFTDYTAPSVAGWKRAALMVAFTLAALGGGAVAGYQYGINTQSPLRNPFNLGLFLRAANDAVAVHWNQFAWPARTAVKAVLTVQEPDGTHTVELSQPELRNGQMLYRTRSPNANFRLEIAMPDSRTVSETVSWKR